MSPILMMKMKTFNQPTQVIQSIEIFVDCPERTFYDVVFTNL